MLLTGMVFAEESGHGAHESHGTHELKRHNLGIFLGETDADENEFTYGLEYEYKFNHRWGGGLTYEKTPDAHHGDGVDVRLISLYLHPFKKFRLGLGYGEERTGGPHPHTEDLTRFSVAYDFHLNENVGLAPSFAIDRVDGETLRVYGIALTFAF